MACSCTFKKHAPVIVDARRRRAQHSEVNLREIPDANSERFVLMLAGRQEDVEKVALDLKLKA